MYPVYRADAGRVHSIDEDIRIHGDPGGGRLVSYVRTVYLFVTASLYFYGVQVLWRVGYTVDIFGTAFVGEI